MYVDICQSHRVPGYRECTPYLHLPSPPGDAVSNQRGTSTFTTSFRLPLMQGTQLGTFRGVLLLFGFVGWEVGEALKPPNKKIPICGGTNGIGDL